MRQQTVEATATLKERVAEVKKVEQEAADVAPLGRYNNPQKSDFEELNGKIAALKSETESLVKSRDEQRKLLKEVNKELDDYQSKYGR